MSKSAIAVAAMFLGLALFQGARGLFVSDAAPPPPPPPPVTQPPTPSVTPSPVETPKLKPFPTFKGRPPEAEAYGSTEELASDLEKRGIECETLQFLDQPDPTLSEFSLCDPGTEMRRFNIYFYETVASREEWLRSMESQKLPLPLAWGPNWIVVAAGEPATAMKRIKSIRGAIGGTIEDFSPKN